MRHEDASVRRPIGVFDSGIGGLTVVSALRSLLPNENINYLGDTARVPYGGKSQPTVERYSLEIAAMLLAENAKMLVVACNTASAGLSSFTTNSSGPAVPVSDVRTAVESRGLAGVIVQGVGQEGREYQVRATTEDEGESDKTAAEIQAGVREKFGEGAFDVMRIEAVGPKVGRDLWRSAALAVLAATVMMGIYIAIRFDFRFGIGAAVAVLHDVLITLGAISITNLEFDLTTVAALLTVVGYSVNDTVVISDRIRENLRKMRRESLATVMNASINETLSRTIITGGTAIIATAVLFWLGGPVIHSFAFTMLFGFIVGTYSSIFIASPIVLYLERGARKRA